VQLQALVGGSAEVIGSGATLAEAARRMVDAHVDCLVVVDKRNLVGILTEHDVVDAVSQDVDLEDAEVSAWMSEAPDTVSPNVPVAEAAAWMLEAGYRHLPVMDGTELLGIVTVRDLLWALTEA
jgi:CBS domain-containing protein